jgi:hypothetical protein
VRKLCNNFIIQCSSDSHISVTKTEFGTLRVTFFSDFGDENGKWAFAYGKTFRQAMANLKRNFNLKYSM